MSRPADRPDGSINQSGEVRSARIESLRALAAFCVMLGHLYAFGRLGQVAAHKLDDLTARGAAGGGGTQTGGFGVEALFGGVFVFFALSGYLLFWPFARQYFGAGRRVELRRYARNRALRILPLYYVALIVVLVVQEHGGRFDQWWRFAFFLENFSHRTAGTVDGPMWSLVVEVIFYAVLPPLAWGVARLAKGSLTRAALVLGIIGLVSFILRLKTVSLASGTISDFWRMSPLNTFCYFIPGMWLALFRLQCDRRRPSWLKGRAAARDAWLLAAMLLWLVFAASPRLEGFAAPASFLTIGACVLPLSEGPLIRRLDWAPLAGLGVASYSLYLWHVPVVLGAIDLFGVAAGRGALVIFIVAVAIACVAIAAVSYRLIEGPFLRMRSRWAQQSAS